MPDSRLAQFIMPAQMIDDEPYLIVGTMAGMIVMQAKMIQDGGMTGIHYVAWHANLPHIPLRQPKPGERIYDFAPWITVTTSRDPKGPTSGKIRYVWEMLEGKFKKIVLHGEFTVVLPEAEIIELRPNKEGGPGLGDGTGESP